MAKKAPRAPLWLDSERKIALGTRIDFAIAKAKTTKAALADKLGYTRSHFTKLCQTGSLSLELATEISRITNTPLDLLVKGSLPASDQSFEDLVRRVRESIEK